MAQHDIRSAIPLTAQTNPGAFPPYEYRAFPKMLVGEKNKNILGSNGEPMVFQSQEEVDDFLENNPEIAEIVRANSPGVKDESARLLQENAVMKKLIAENEALRAKLEAKGAVDLTPDEEVEDEPKPARQKKHRKRQVKRLG